MLILLLLGVGAAWCLQYKIYEKYWGYHLEVRTEFEDTAVYEGEYSCLREEISNQKRLPLPALEVRLAISRNLKFAGEAKANSSITDQNYKRDLFSFFSWQKVIRRLPFACTKRGFYEIRRAELVGHDLFYRFNFYQERGQQSQLYVYPRQVDAGRISLICQAISGMVLVQSRLYPDPFEFAGIRTYVPTDPMRRINWKASARGQELMVNQYDSTTSIRATLILDVEDSNILKYEALTEESIRILSSLAARLVKAGMEFDIESNAVSAGDGRTGRLAMHVKSGGAQMQELNRRLACVSLEESKTEIAPLLERMSSEKRSGHIYVLISKNQTEEIKRQLRQLSAGGNQTLWIIPVHSYMEAEETAVPGMRWMRWETEI